MPTGGMNTLARQLFHSVDTNSIKTDKYVDHGTAILKLVSAPVRRVLLKLASEDVNQ